MLLKASSITNLTDARYFAAREVDFLGFNLEQGTEHFLDPIFMKAIREWITGPTIVGEFHQSELKAVAEAAAFYGLESVEVPLKKAEELEALEDLQVLLYAPASLGPDKIQQLIDTAGDRFEHLVLDFGNTKWPEIQKHAASWQNALQSSSVLFQYDFEPETVEEASRFLPKLGFGFIGAEEEKVGVKSFDAIDELFEVLGIDNM